MSFAPLELPEVDDKRSFDAIDPFDGRYFDKQVSQYLSEGARIRYQAYVEAALAQTLVENDITTQQIADEIEKAARTIDPVTVAEEEQRTKHDVKALVDTIKSQVSDEAKPFVHLTATSYDIVSTASAVQYREAVKNVLIPKLASLVELLEELSDKYMDTVQIGRSHGQHGVPITFGYALSVYVERLNSSVRSLGVLMSKLQGKFSGAMGTYNASALFVDDPREFEKSIMDKLELTAAPRSTQIVPPETLTRLLCEVALAAGTMADLANDMRQLQRSEIAEIREKFDPNQTGSSTMAHKRNPISFENVVSINKVVQANLTIANQNLISEHQRDLTDSASARFYPLVLAGAAQMATRLQNALSKIEVDEEAMKRNLELSGGAIAAEPVYLLLAKHGHTQAHEEAKRVAHLAMDSGVSYAEAIQQDDQLKDYWAKFTDEEKAIVENPAQNYLGLSKFS